MTQETIKRGVQVAVACGVLLCAAASAQQPASSVAAAQTQAATTIATNAEPVTGIARRPTNIDPDSPMAKLSIDAPIVEPAQAGEETAGKSKDGSVKIHGHWVIELKEKDGTVKERREFDNSYVGGNNMGLYLAGFFIPVDPAITIGSSSNSASSLCNGEDNAVGQTNNVCSIFSSLTAGHGAVDTTIGYCAVAGSCYSGLTTTLMPAGGPYTSWVLSATVAPVTTGTFDTVKTSLTGCYNPYYDSAATVSPSACYTNAVTYYNNTFPTPITSPYLGNFDFTATVLPGGAVTVTAGETLVFTVTISFS